MTERKDAQVTLQPPQNLCLPKAYDASWVSQWPTMPCLVDFKMSRVIIPGITPINEENCQFDLIIEDGELWITAHNKNLVRLNGELIVSDRLYVGDTIDVADQHWIVEGGEAWHRIQNSEILENLLHVEEILAESHFMISEKHDTKAEWLNHQELAEELEHFRKRLNRWLSWQALASPANKILESSNGENTEKNINLSNQIPVPIPESIFLKPSTLAQLVDEVHQAAQNDIFLDSTDLAPKNNVSTPHKNHDVLKNIIRNKKFNKLLQLSIGCLCAVFTFWLLIYLT